MLVFKEAFQKNDIHTKLTMTFEDSSLTLVSNVA